ncbi:MAG: VWA domain-containing protein, partial [Myxococcales bacterium]|nr:VWA domain-containing protein [Myxococcales bacterium]
DDSMSLASAQRVLYALKRHVPLKTSEIRPHELLNYFSFDTAEPAPGRVFSVLGGAEQDGETLTVSLAVKGATPEREPLDLTLLVDRSCSMGAEGRMDYTRRGLQLMTEQLQDGDRLDLVLFDSDVCTPVQNFVVGRDDPSVLNDALARMRPNTGTNLDAGLQTAYGIQTGRDAAEVHGRNRRVLLITDALLNEGRVQESLVAQVGKNLEEHDIRLSGVGVGREFNDKMLDKLTENGKGAYVYLGSEAVVDRVFGPGFDALTRTVAHDVHFALDLPDSLAMERFYGEEASTNKADVQPIHYFAGTTQLFLQDLRVRPGGVVRNDPITMRIEYTDAITGEPEVQELRTTVGALLDGDPHNLRKGQALMAFSDIVLAQSMGGGGCGAPLQAYRQRSGAVPGDAEITYVNGLVGDLCHVEMTTVVTRGVQLKLKLDSDQPIASVDLRCGGQHTTQRLTAADQIARFEDITPGMCTVELQGNLPITAEVEVPESGGDLRCMVRGGRVSCT